MDEKSRQKVISLLEGVLNNTISAQAALDAWPNMDNESDKNIKSVWHELYHYHADDDIRAKDAQYAEWQKGRISQLLSDIRQRT